VYHLEQLEKRRHGGRDACTEISNQVRIFAQN
jgi:hypothetical protein